MYHWSCGSVSQNHIWSSPDHRSRNSFWALSYITQANPCCRPSPPPPMAHFILSYYMRWEMLKHHYLLKSKVGDLFLMQGCLPKHCQVLLFRALQKSTHATRIQSLTRQSITDTHFYWKAIKTQLLFSHHINYNIFKVFFYMGKFRKHCQFRLPCRDL